jgi:hypothetical protein
MRTLFAIPLFLALLQACSTTYKPPVAGPTASLTVTTTHGGINMPIRRYKTDNCSDYPGELVGRFNSKTIGESSYRSTTTAIKADEPFRMSVQAVLDTKMTGNMLNIFHCQPVVEFVPKRGRQYEALHQIGPVGCTIVISDITDGSRTRETTARISPTCPANKY